MWTFLFYCFVFQIANICIAQQSLTGHYMARAKDYTMDLLLKPDSSFVFRYSGFEFNKTGVGNWEMRKNDTLVLKCQDTNQSSFGFTQDYIKGDTVKFFVKNGRLKYGLTTLNKIK